MQSVGSEVEDSKSGTGTPDAGLADLAFGAEKMGLVSLKAPLVVGIVFALLAIAAVFGAMRLTVDDSLSQLFRSKHAAISSVRGGHARLPLLGI